MDKRYFYVNELTLQEKQLCNGGGDLSPLTQKFWETLGELFMTPFLVSHNVGPYAGPVLDK